MTDRPYPTRNVDNVKADIARFGFGILEGALPDHITTAIRERLLDQAAAERACHIDIGNASVEPDDGVNQWVAMLPNKGGVFRELINNENCLALVRSILGRDAILSEFSAHITWPGNKEMALHIDQWFMPQPVTPSPDYNRASEVTRADQPFGDPVPTSRAITCLWWQTPCGRSAISPGRMAPPAWCRQVTSPATTPNLLAITTVSGPRHRPAASLFGKAAPGMRQASTPATRLAWGSRPIGERRFLRQTAQLHLWIEAGGRRRSK